MATKYTPGPWSFTLDPHTMNASIRGAPRTRGCRRQHVAEVWSGDRPDMDTVRANAALVAAAPELLAALRDAIGALEDASYQCDPLEAARKGRAILDRFDTCTLED